MKFKQRERKKKKSHTKTTVLRRNQRIQFVQKVLKKINLKKTPEKKEKKQPK